MVPGANELSPIVRFPLRVNRKCRILSKGCGIFIWSYYCQVERNVLSVRRVPILRFLRCARCDDIIHEVVDDFKGAIGFHLPPAVLNADEGVTFGCDSELKTPLMKLHCGNGRYNDVVCSVEREEGSIVFVEVGERAEDGCFFEVVEH